MNRLTRKELILYLIVLGLVLVVFISYLILNFRVNQENLLPQPSQRPFSSGEPISEPQVSTPSSLPRTSFSKEKEENISKLIEDLPFDGSYAHIIYDKSSMKFAYAYRQEYLQASENELSNYLDNFQLTKEDLQSWGLEEFFY